MEYIVKADSLTGIKGAKYKKGSVVKDFFFHPGHAKQLESNGSIEKVETKKATKKDKE